MATKPKWKAFSEIEIKQFFQESFSYRETYLKMGYLGGSATQTMKELEKKFDIDTTHFTGQAHKKNTGKYRTPIEKYLNNEQAITSHKLRLRLLAEGYFVHQCQSCSSTEWLGNPIPLELHHKDGNKLNNNLDNLEMLCPNCHVFTDTYKTKNINS